MCNRPLWRTHLNFHLKACLWESLVIYKTVHQCRQLLILINGINPKAEIKFIQRYNVIELKVLKLY